MLSEAIEEAIALLVNKTTNNTNSEDDLRFTQAALNLAYTLSAIGKVESRPDPNTVYPNLTQK